MTGVVVRVGEPGKPCFQLRKGEQGISVFDPDAVDPPLADAAILACFKPGSQLIIRAIAIIQAKGLDVIRVEGAPTLPPRLREAHHEIVPGPGMNRTVYKTKLKELE